MEVFQAKGNDIRVKFKSSERNEAKGVTRQH